MNKIPSKYLRLLVYKSFNEKAYINCGQTGLCGFLSFNPMLFLWRLRIQPKIDDIISFFPELYKQKPSNIIHNGFWWDQENYSVRQEVIKNAIKEIQNETR